jgi:hypothetical protein
LVTGKTLAVLRKEAEIDNMEMEARELIVFTILGFARRR